MKKIIILSTIIFLTLQVKSQYITDVYEYVPAPGQFINSSPWGVGTSGNTLIGGINGSVSLGAFGGYIVFGFGAPVENHPDNPFGIDFIIYGNPLETWSEPGIVYVMKDENGNGLPDDTWYEIAGSDYHFNSTIKDYRVTYYNPNSPQAADVPWTDNYGNTGYIFANEFHGQPYYPLAENFPNVNQDQYTLSGTKIEGCVNKTVPTYIESYRRGFGYADNVHKKSFEFDNVPDNPYTHGIVENSGGDGIDISWAVDQDGNYVNLDKIDFVKIQCGVLEDAGWLGEVSTEIRGAVVVTPNSSISGVMDMVYLKDILQIYESPHQMEVVTFHNGRPTNDELIWTVSSDDPSVQIDDAGVLTYNMGIDDVNITVTAALKNNPDIKHTINTKIFAPESIDDISNDSFYIYPNPANDKLYIDINENVNIIIYDMVGNNIMETVYKPGDAIDVSTFASGLYVLRIVKDNTILSNKFIKY